MVFGLGNKKKSGGKSVNAPTRSRGNKGMSASIKRYFLAYLASIAPPKKR